MDSALNFRYDARSDGLYCSIDSPRPAVSAEVEPGVLVRVDLDTSQITGFTVMDVTKRRGVSASWQMPLAGLVDRRRPA